MPDVVDLLERLADHPPSPPLPAEEVRARARRRRQRHRRQRAVAVGLGLIMVVALAVTSFTVLTGSEPDVRAAGPRPGGPPGPDGPTLTESQGGLTVDPSSGLGDGDTVTLSLDPDPGGEVVATQCATEVLDFTDLEPTRVAALPTPWCGSVFYLRDPAGRPDLTMPVSRIQSTPAGDVDCASSPGRCVVMVGSAFTVDRVAPLVFAEDLPEVAVPTLEVESWDGLIEDGEVVFVTGRDLPRSLGEVTLGQCIGELEDVFDGSNDRCDLARTVTVPVAADGTFAAQVRLFRDVVTPESAAAQPGAVSWVACEPCLLVAGDARLPIDVTVTGEPVRPTMRITTSGPYRPAQRVRIEGEGFQGGQEVGIASCVADSMQACGFPDEGFVAADAEGRVAVDDYPLPAGDALGGACTSRPGACVVTWSPSTEGTAPAITIPLDLSG